MVNACPLPFAYKLLYASVDNTNATKKVTHAETTLFDAQTRAGTDTETKVHIVPLHGRVERTIIAVVAAMGSDQNQWPVVASGEARIEAQGRQLSARLIGPRTVELRLGRSVLQPLSGDGPKTAADLHRLQPTELDQPGHSQLDVAVILDSNWHASESESTIRAAVAKQFLEKLTTDMQGKTTTRAALVAYRDYASWLYGGTREAVTIADFRDPQEIIGSLDSQFASRASQFEAAYEAALHAVLDLDWDPDVTTRRVLVSFVASPPYPRIPVGGWAQISSPAGFDWNDLLLRLRTEICCDSIVIWSLPVWRVNTNQVGPPNHAEEYAQSCWQTIGFGGKLQFEQVERDVTDLVLAAAWAPCLPRLA
jgi:hypothetical protein